MANEISQVMKCSICATEEASVHITRTLGKSSPAIHLCRACAEKLGVNDPAGFSLADLLSAVRAAQESGQNAKSKLSIASHREIEKGPGSEPTLVQRAPPGR